MITDKHTITGDPSQYLLIRYCDGCVFTDGVPDDIAPYLARHTTWDATCETSLHIGRQYDRSRIAHVLQRQGPNLRLADGRLLEVIGWLAFPRDRIHECGEVYQQDRLVLLCRGNERYHTDCQRVIDRLWEWLIDAGDMESDPLYVRVTLDKSMYDRDVCVDAYFHSEVNNEQS